MGFWGVFERDFFGIMGFSERKFIFLLDFSLLGDYFFKNLLRFWNLALEIGIFGNFLHINFIISIQKFLKFLGFWLRFFSFLFVNLRIMGFLFSKFPKIPLFSSILGNYGVLGLFLFEKFRNYGVLGCIFKKILRNFSDLFGKLGIMGFFF